MNVPFQVMCVFIGTVGEGYGLEEAPLRIVVGSEYTVISKFRDETGDYFELSHHLDFVYPVEFFATLPDPFEEVAIEHEQEAIIYQR